MGSRYLATAIPILTLFCGLAGQAGGIERVQAPPPKPSMMEGCPGLIASDRPRVVPAAFRPDHDDFGSIRSKIMNVIDSNTLEHDVVRKPLRTFRHHALVALTSDQVRITYVGHSTFLLESPRVVRIATDYNDYVRPPVLPDIATMNHAHSTHFTDAPDPAIAHVLRGWASELGKPVQHDLQFKDVRVRNVPTNIRDWGGGTQRHGNSIFVFEIADLCIAHLGHLHHTLTQQQLNEIGRIDAVLVPVDGSYTLDIEGMVEVLDSLKAPLVIPMHYFSVFTLNRFLDRMREKFDVETSETPSVVMSKATLPVKPKVLVLPGR